MISYILEATAFQLIFLLVYDLLLRGETFFTWNRFYLLGTFTASLGLPHIKIDSINNVLPGISSWNAYYFQTLDEVIVSAPGTGIFLADIPWIPVLFAIGAFSGMLLFLVKLRKIYQLKTDNVVQEFAGFTKIIVANSTAAFSFFRYLFIGDRIQGKAAKQIIAHEQVHISGYHSLDLLYFELLRIGFWFNPMVYLFQARISELHEFIADDKVPLEDRGEQYHLMLSHVFDTYGISFINQFFKSSLIKKRIVMLKKTRSHRIWKFKYLLLIPLMALMLCYSACRDESRDMVENTMQVADVDNLTALEEQEIFKNVMALSQNNGSWEYTVSDGVSTLRFVEGDGNSYLSGPAGEQIRARMIIEGNASVDMGNLFGGSSKPIPFGEADTVPIFPGCEEAEDTRACFNQSMQTHIRKNFNYPKEAIDQGIEGKVSLMFTINEKGIVSDVRSRGPHKILEAEAERIINRLPDMLAAEKDGQAVKIFYSVPITFQLN